MLRIALRNSAGLKHPVYSSLTLSFASLGDAFLYPFLPQYSELMHIPVVWIGLLLSINRIIRIVFNPFVVKIFGRYGFRQVTIAASAMAILSTIGYAAGWGLIALLFFRVIWGMAFAILRISTLAYAMQYENPGVSMGLSRSVQEAGPLFSLWAGPLLLVYFPGPEIFFLLGLFSIPSLLYAFLLPDLSRGVSTQTPGFVFPSLLNTATFFISFVIEGMLIVVTGLFLSYNNTALSYAAIAILAAGYLAYRRICFIFLSPVSGAIAERLGFTTVFLLTMLMIVAGLILLLNGWIATGLVLIFAFNSVNSTIAPGVAAEKETDKLRAVAANASWRDIGAAGGALAGGLLLPGRFLFGSFAIATFILAGLSIMLFRKTKQG